MRFVIARVPSAAKVTEHPSTGPPPPSRDRSRRTGPPRLLRRRRRSNRLGQSKSFFEVRVVVRGELR
jgi:hypothetical protein